MRLSVLANHCFEIDVLAELRRYPLVERGGRLSAECPDGIALQRPFDDVRDRSVLPIRQPMSEIARAGASDRKRGFRRLRQTAAVARGAPPPKLPISPLVGEMPAGEGARRNAGGAK